MLARKPGRRWAGRSAPMGSPAIRRRSARRRGSPGRTRPIAARWNAPPEPSIWSAISSTRRPATWAPPSLPTPPSAWAARMARRSPSSSAKRCFSENYPAIHAVGRRERRAPRLIDLRWGRTGPRITLVGKGVCFDSGGLDIKTAGNMKLMKKDMGGAAHVLGLAQMIMAAQLPVRLRMLIPAVENSISGNAFRPLDVLRTRKGLTVEIGNTDAEGRLILCDALAEADREGPDLLIDCATLTGAARVALGPDLPALFSNHDATAEALLRHGPAERDPLWRMPLFKPYRRGLDSKVADLNNIWDGPFAGAITAALFLQEFVSAEDALGCIST